jgi:hypothetical protein
VTPGRSPDVTPQTRMVERNHDDITIDGPRAAPSPAEGPAYDPLCDRGVVLAQVGMDVRTIETIVGDAPRLNALHL